MRVNEHRWKLFLETHVTELEKFGADVRLIEGLQREGLERIRNIQYFTEDDLLSLVNWGGTSISQLKLAIEGMWKFFDNGGTEDELERIRPPTGGRSRKA